MSEWRWLVSKLSSLLLPAGVKRNPWDRADRESDRAWEAFKYYRELGSSARSLAVVGTDFALDHKTVWRWAQKHDWQGRAAAWDVHLDQIRQREYEATASTMGRRHAEIGMSLQEHGVKRVKEYVEKPELSATITLREALDVTKAGVEIERNARAGTDNKTKGNGTIIFQINQIGGKAPKWAPDKVKQTIDAVINVADAVEDSVKSVLDSGGDHDLPV